MSFLCWIDDNPPPEPTTNKIMQRSTPSGRSRTPYLYVDVSNVNIEGKRLATLRKNTRFAADVDLANVPLDHGWRLDYRRLAELLCGDLEHAGALVAYGSEFNSGGFWNQIERLGFETTTFDRCKYTGERKVDTAIAHSITKDAYTRIDSRTSEIVLVAGDKDYCPVVDGLVSDGYEVCVAFWSHVSRELHGVCSSFFALDDYFELLTLRSRDRVTVKACGRL